MTTHKQQHPAFYLLLLALACCINVSLQAMKQSAIPDNKYFTFACCINKKLQAMKKDKNQSTLFYSNENNDWIGKDFAWIKEYIEKIINETSKKKPKVDKKKKKINLKKCCPHVLHLNLKNPARFDRLYAIASKQLRKEYQSTNKKKKSTLFFTYGSIEEQDAIVEMFKKTKINYISGDDDYDCLIVKKNNLQWIRAILPLLGTNEKHVIHTILPIRIPVYAQVGAKKLPLSPLTLFILYKLHNNGCDSNVRAYVPTKYGREINNMKRLGFKKEKRSAPKGYTSLNLSKEEHQKLCRQALAKQSPTKK